MVSTDALFRIADAAEEAGNYDLARKSFERGASLGDSMCLCRLAYLFDTGIGVEADKRLAMRFYQQAWRMDRNAVAGGNIAVLYREQTNWRQSFRWWQRVAELGDGSAQLESAKCYLRGRGVKRDLQAALRCLAAAEASIYITEYERELARRLLRKLLPQRVK
jgi:TPR repeat protein